MANPAYGLQFSRTLHGGQPVVRRYYIPSTESTALAMGDVVEITNTTGALDPKKQVPTIAPFVSGHIPLGVVEGFGVDSSALVTGNYRAASTNRYVEVNVDPDSCYYAMQDDVGGTLSAANIGAMCNINLIVTTPTNGVSGTMVDSSTPTASAADVKVVGVKADGVSVGGSVLAELEVMLNGAAFRATDSQS